MNFYANISSVSGLALCDKGGAAPGMQPEFCNPKPDGHVRKADVSGCKSRTLFGGRGVFRPVLSGLLETADREPLITQMQNVKDPRLARESSAAHGWNQPAGVEYTDCNIGVKCLKKRVVKKCFTAGGKRVESARIRKERKTRQAGSRPGYFRNAFV